MYIIGLYCQYLLRYEKEQRKDHECGCLEAVDGVEPGVDGGAAGAQQVPVQLREVNLLRDRRLRRGGKVEPNRLELRQGCIFSVQLIILSLSFYFSL